MMESQSLSERQSKESTRNGAVYNEKQIVPHVPTEIATLPKPRFTNTSLGSSSRTQDIPSSPQPPHILNRSSPQSPGVEHNYQFFDTPHMPIFSQCLKNTGICRIAILGEINTTLLKLGFSDLCLRVPSHYPLSPC